MQSDQLSPYFIGARAPFHPISILFDFNQLTRQSTVFKRFLDRVVAVVVVVDVVVCLLYYYITDDVRILYYDPK